MSRSESDRGFTLIELVMVCALLQIVMAIITSFLISTQRAVATSAIRISDSADARTAMEQLDLNVRFASELAIPTGGHALYVLNGSTCYEWTISSGALTRQAGTKPASTIIEGAVAPSSGATFASNSSYPGLVSIRFTVQQNSKADNGFAVDQSLFAENAGSVKQQSGC